MNDNEIEPMMRRAEPEAGLAGMLHAAGQELLEEIMSTSATSQEDSGSDAVEIRAGQVVPLKGRRNRSRWLLGVAAAVAVVLAVALPMRLFKDSPAGGDAQITAAAFPQTELTGTGIPYFVLDQDLVVGSLMASVAGYRAELVSADNSRGVEIDVHHPASDWRQLKSDEPAVVEGDRVEPVTMFGLQGELEFPVGDYFQYQLTVEYQDSRLLFSGRGFSGLDEFAAVLGDLRQLSEQEWLDALPATVVTPQRADEAIGEMLAGVTVPDDFRPEQIAVNWPIDRALVTFDVISAVGCTWMKDYRQAYDREDEATMDLAAQAMQGTRKWKALQELEHYDELRQAFREVADQMGDREKLPERNVLTDQACPEPVG